MAVWNGLKAWSPGDPLLSQDFLNHINANLDYLLKPNNLNLSSTATYTTSSTSAVAVNAALTGTITMNGGHLLVGAQFVPTITGAGAYSVTIYITIAGVNHTVWTGAVGSGQLVAPVFIVTGLSAATHNVSLRWLVSNGAAVASMVGTNVPIRLFAVEI